MASRPDELGKERRTKLYRTYSEFGFPQHNRSECRQNLTGSNPKRLTHEESPSTTEQECRLTACEGDFKESATEIYRNFVL